MDNFLNIHKASLKQNLLIVKNDKKKKKLHFETLFRRKKNPVEVPRSLPLYAVETYILH